MRPNKLNRLNHTISPSFRCEEIKNRRIIVSLIKKKKKLQNIQHNLKKKKSFSDLPLTSDVTSAREQTLGLCRSEEFPLLRGKCSCWGVRDATQISTWSEWRAATGWWDTEGEAGVEKDYFRKQNTVCTTRASIFNSCLSKSDVFKMGSSKINEL